MRGDWMERNDALSDLQVESIEVKKIQREETSEDRRNFLIAIKIKSYVTNL